MCVYFFILAEGEVRSGGFVYVFNVWIHGLISRYEASLYQHTLHTLHTLHKRSQTQTWDIGLKLYTISQNTRDTPSSVDDKLADFPVFSAK